MSNHSETDEAYKIYLSWCDYAEQHKLFPEAQEQAPLEADPWEFCRRLESRLTEELQRCLEEKGLLEGTLDSRNRNLEDIQNNYRQLESRLADAEQRLRFYADEQNHLRPEFPPISEVEKDKGQLAREYFKDKS